MLCYTIYMYYSPDRTPRHSLGNLDRLPWQPDSVFVKFVELWSKYRCPWKTWGKQQTVNNYCFISHNIWGKWNIFSWKCTTLIYNLCPKAGRLIITYCIYSKTPAETVRSMPVGPTPFAPWTGDPVISVIPEYGTTYPALRERLVSTPVSLAPSSRPCTCWVSCRKEELHLFVSSEASQTSNPRRNQRLLVSKLVECNL